MTRRKFIHRLTLIGAVFLAGAFTFARRVSAQRVKLRKFIRAIPMKRYPSCVRRLDCIFKQGKWSG